MAKKTLSLGQRRQLKSDLAKLKKAGIVSKKFNVRSARPTKKNLELLKEYRGIVDGRLKTVKLPKAKAERNKEDGLKVVRDRVIIENAPGSKVIRLPSDPYGFRIEHEEIGGIKPIEFKGGKNSLDKYAEMADAEIKKGNAVGFTVDGHRSRMLYNSASEAIKAFRGYANRDKISSFTIYRVPRGKRFKWKGDPPKKRRKK